MELKFYVCKHCGNIIIYVKNAGVPVICCGEKMVEIVPNTSDGAGEKHVPVVTKDGNTVTVKVGSVEHPMLDVHFIEWIALATNKGCYTKRLKPGQEPVAKFVLDADEEVVNAYEYCNLHGLWKA